MVYIIRVVIGMVSLTLTKLHTPDPAGAYWQEKETLQDRCFKLPVFCLRSEG